jgi:hypothetical protein
MKARTDRIQWLRLIRTFARNKQLGDYFLLID